MDEKFTSLLEAYLKNRYNTKIMRICGLHFDAPYLSLASLEMRGKKPVVLSLRPMVLVNPDNVKQFYIPKSVNLTSVAMPALLRRLHFKISSAKQIEKILPFQVESLTSMNLEKIVYTTILRPQKSETDATVYLTSKDRLKKKLEELNAYSIAPDRAVAAFAALAKFSKHFLPDLSSTFVVDLGSQEWSCIWIENHEIKKGFTIDQGIESILSALWEDLKKVVFQKEVERTCCQMDLLQLNHLQHPHLAEKLEEARNALANVLHSFQKESGPKPIVFTGRTDAFIHLCQYLVQPMPELSLVSNETISIDEQKCAIAIGSAIEEETQFLTGEYTPKKTWERAGTWALSLLLLSLSLTTGMFFYGRAKLQSEKETLAGSFQQLLQGSDRKLSESLFLNNIEQGIEEAALAIQKYDKETPYILQSPNVTEVLAWLSSHPLIMALQETEDPIKIQNVKYQLTSYPHIDAMRDGYSAKVDLEFSVNSPMSARKFHEALLQEEFINGKEELTWESSGNVYQTSFVLKNKAFNVR